MEKISHAKDAYNLSHAIGFTHLQSLHAARDIMYIFVALHEIIFPKNKDEF
jgi:hypothetical protein